MSENKHSPNMPTDSKKTFTIKQLQKRFPPSSSSPAPPSHCGKKVIHFLTHKESLYFEDSNEQLHPKLSEDNFCFWHFFCVTPFRGVFGVFLGRCTKTVVKKYSTFDPQGASRFWWAQKQNCPKLSKDNFCFWPKISKLKNKTKKWPLKVQKHCLTHKECPYFDFDFDELPSKLSEDHFCFWSRFSKLKNQTKKWPLKIQKPKISLKSQNVRKQTLPKYSHCLQNNFKNFKK